MCESGNNIENYLGNVYSIILTLQGTCMCGLRFYILIFILHENMNTNIDFIDFERYISLISAQK